MAPKTVPPCWWTERATSPIRPTLPPPYTSRWPRLAISPPSSRAARRWTSGSPDAEPQNTHTDRPMPSSPDVALEAVLVEGADHGEGARFGAEDLLGHRAHVGVADGVHPADHLVEGEDLAVGQLRLAKAGHAAGGVLHTEHQRALEVALAPLQLCFGQPVGDHPLQLVADDRQHLVDALGRRAGVHRERAGLRVLRGVGVDRVDQATLLAHLLEQPRADAAAEGEVEHPEGEAARVGAGQPPAAEYHVRLLGRLAAHQHPAVQPRLLPPR